MISELVATAVGAVLGAGATAVGSLKVALRAEREREKRQLIAAIAIVAAELNENAVRLEQEKPVQELTLGDWSVSKGRVCPSPRV